MRLPRFARNDTRMRLPRFTRNDTRLRLPRFARNDTRMRLSHLASNDTIDSSHLLGDYHALLALKFIYNELG